MRTVHVGYHKTGTSWLQRNVLPTCVGATYVRPGIAGTAGEQWAIKSLVRVPPGGAFDPRAMASHLPDDLVVSYEDLLGHPWADPRYPMEMERILDRLAAVLPDARIVLVTRRPDGWYRSLHAEYVRGGGTAGFRRFVRSVLRPEYVDTDQVVARLRARFPAVHTLAYEDLQQDPEAFVARFGAIAGATFEILDRTPVYVSLRGRRLLAARAGNLFRRAV